VGFSAAIKAIKQVGATLKLDLAQYRELALRAVRQRPRQGYPEPAQPRFALTELLKQPQFHPLRAEQQVIILFSGTQGYLDDLRFDQIRAFEDGLYPYLDSAQSQLLNDIATKKALDDDLRNRIHAALKEYKANFVAEHERREAEAERRAAVERAGQSKKEQEQKASSR